jgi:hypothetical protein
MRAPATTKSGLAVGLAVGVAVWPVGQVRTRTSRPSPKTPSVASS